MKRLKDLGIQKKIVKTVVLLGIIALLLPLSLPTAYASPGVVTLDAVNITSTSALVQGFSDEASCTERGFDWGLTDSYGESWTETGTFGPGTFSHLISGLTPGTTYHFRAKVYNTTWIYGNDTAFQTVGPDGMYCYTYDYYDANLVSYDATYATAHDATDADYTNYVGTYFEMGQTLSGGVHYIYRGILQFDTSALPSDAVITSASVHLYGKTDYSTTDFNIVLVRASQVHSPPVISDFGALLMETESRNNVFSTSSFATDGYNELVLNSVGLGDIVREGVTKFGIRSSEDINDSAPSGDEYVEIWSSESGHPPILNVTYAIPGLGEPVTISIEGSQVFTNYLTSGDQLYVFRYKVIYETEPSESPGEYYWLQLLDGSTMKAQVPLPAWGYKPGAIYLNSDYALTWGDTYTIRVIGNTNKFSSPSSAQQTLTAERWKGEDLDVLDIWVRGSAVAIGNYYGVDYLVDIGGTWKLTDSGGAMFLEGIPYLGTIRPGLFSVIVEEYTWPERETSDDTFQQSMLSNLGATITGWFNNFGDVFGVSGSFVGAAIWVVMMAGVSGFIVIRTGSTMGGVLCAVPLLLIGGYLGMIPLVVLAVIGLVLIGLTLQQIWLKGV